MRSRHLLALPAVVVALVALLAAEAAAAMSGEGSPEAPGSPNAVFGPASGRPLVFVVLGDSTGSGVGAVSQDNGFPRLVARALATRTGRRVDLRVFAVSGARVADVLHDQVPRMRGVSPDLVLVVVGGNDVTHLTSPDAARRDLGQVLDALPQQPGRVIVSGIPAMGTVTRIGQPLRALVGLIAKRVYDPVWREETDARSMIRVDLAAETGPAFEKDPSLLAPDGFHPSPGGYRVWADAFTRALARTDPGSG